MASDDTKKSAQNVLSGIGQALSGTGQALFNLKEVQQRQELIEQRKQETELQRQQVEQQIKLQKFSMGMSTLERIGSSQGKMRENYVNATHGQLQDWLNVPISKQALIYDEKGEHTTRIVNAVYFPGTIDHKKLFESASFLADGDLQTASSMMQTIMALEREHKKRKAREELTGLEDPKTEVAQEMGFTAKAGQTLDPKNPKIELATPEEQRSGGITANQAEKVIQLKSDERKTLREAGTDIQSGETLLTLLDNPEVQETIGGFTGAIAQFLANDTITKLSFGQSVKGLSTPVRQFMRSQEAFFQEYRGKVTGAQASHKELAWLRPLLPSMFDTPEQANLGFRIVVESDKMAKAKNIAMMVLQRPEGLREETLNRISAGKEVRELAREIIASGGEFNIRERLVEKFPILAGDEIKKDYSVYNDNELVSRIREAAAIVKDPNASAKERQRAQQLGRELIQEGKRRRQKQKTLIQDTKTMVQDTKADIRNQGRQ